MDEHRALEELQREIRDRRRLGMPTGDLPEQEAEMRRALKLRPHRASRNRQPHRRKPQVHQSSAGPCPTRSASSWSDGTKNTTAEGE